MSELPHGTVTLLFSDVEGSTRLQHRLGERYLVWDQAARIEFVAPGRGTVTARFELPEARVAGIREHAAGGAKVLPEFEVEIRDESGALVATVHKTVYVRLKPRYRAPT